MRGLNKSFVDSAQKLLERSPDANFSQLFEQYKNHLATFSFSYKKEEPKKSSVVPASESIGMPIRHIETGDFKMFNTISDSVEKNAEVIRPLEEEQKAETQLSSGEKLESTSVEPSKANTGFSFGSNTNNTSETVEPKPFDSINVISDVPVESKTIAEDFNPIESTTTTSIIPTAVPEVKPFCFKSIVKSERTAAEAKNSFNSFEAPKIYNFGSSKTNNLAETFKPFNFGSNSTEAAVPVEVNITEAAKPFNFGTTEAPKSFSFGSGISNAKIPIETFKPFNFGSSAIKTTSTEAPKSFSFGSTIEAPNIFKFESSQAVASPENASFESSSASSNPKPFSFEAAGTLPTFSFGASTNGFAFTAPPSLIKSNQSGDEGDEIPAEEAESFNLTRTNSEQMKTGAGEENETSQYEERCKVFSMDTTNNGWIDLGVGIFKINRYNNEPGKSRVLCRAEGSGKVILNTFVSVPGTDVSKMEGKKEVAMLAIGPEGKPTKYLIRVKTLEQADSLKSALNSEIEYVKSNKN